MRVLTSTRVKRFADEILRAGCQRPQLVARLGRDHEYRKIAIGFDFLQPFHHLEAIHAGHLQIEQDQVVVVVAMQRAHGTRIRRRRHAPIAGFTQHLLQQLHIGFLIVYDQNTGVKNIFATYHKIRFPSFALRLSPMRTGYVNYAPSPTVALRCDSRSCRCAWPHTRPDPHFSSASPPPRHAWDKY